MARRRHPMLGRQGCAGDVESMLAARFLVFGSEAISKLRAVVCQDLAEFDGEASLSRLRKSTLLASIM